MYIPGWFREENIAVLHELMRQYSFATLVTAGGDIPFATHLPFVIQTGKGVYGTLLAHMARANPQWQHFAAGQEALVIFQGPHAYISPTLYTAQPSVPTWNYAVVHAYGTPRLLEDEELFAALHTLVAQYEADPGKLDMPDDFVRKLMRGIVGFELPISRLEGKFKMSQNQSNIDRQRVIEALQEAQDPLIAELADRMCAADKEYLSHP